MAKQEIDTNNGMTHLVQYLTSVGQRIQPLCAPGQFEGRENMGYMNSANRGPGDEIDLGS